MFVSSYNTYIQTNNSNKARKDVEKSNESRSDFASTLKTQPVRVENHSEIPSNFLSTNQILKNRQKIEYQQQKSSTPNNKEIVKTVNIANRFTQFKTLNNAKTAYNDNSKMFSLKRKPLLTLDQTPKIEKNISEDLKKVKEQNLRNTMVNTYISNENYYKITA